jgi:hypothetical protein
MLREGHGLTIFVNIFGRKGEKVARDSLIPHQILY